MPNFTTEDALLYQSSSNTSLSDYRSRSSNLAEKYKQPATYIDNILLGRVSTLNSIKQNIVSVGGNTGLTTTCYSSSTTFITSTYGSMVVSTAVTAASNLGIVGLSSELVAYGVIKYDSLTAYNYPKVENLDPSDPYPYTGEGYVGINSGNAGIGKNSVYTVSGGSNVGYVFSILTSGGCTGTSIASSVTNLISQYNSSAAGISTYTDDVSTIKNYRMEYQFQSWSYSRKIQEDSNYETSQTNLRQITNSPSYGGPYSIPLDSTL